ncbi:MAG: hypothetical protein HYZ75_01210 [Elusimicrobia bacterium]|nr:hypothetical protein [Elusimicrobiota bacterium]
MVRTAFRGLALALLLPALSGAAQPGTYRPAGPGEVPNLLFGAVKDWAAGLSEMKLFEEYIRDRHAWSPRFKVGAGVAGAAFGYLEGGEGSVELGAWELMLDTSGRQLHHSLRSGNGKLCSIGLGRPDKGWTAEAAIGLRDGRVLGQSVAVAYKLRFSAWAP